MVWRTYFRETSQTAKGAHKFYAGAVIKSFNMKVLDRMLIKLENENMQIRVGMVGAGFMAKAIAYQLCNFSPGISLVAISNRSLSKAKRAYSDAGIVNVEEVNSACALEQNIRLGKHSVTSNPLVLTAAKGIDLIIEVTGTVELSAKVTMNALKNKKHVILVNAALNATLGPILTVYAKRAGVVLTQTEGSIAGTAMNLYDYVKSIGIEPVICGSMELLDLNSISDGSTSSFEMAVLANAAGLRFLPGGMPGLRLLANEAGFISADFSEQPDAMYPESGVFVLSSTANSVQQKHLLANKAGSLYLFKEQVKATQFELAGTIARAAILGDPALCTLDKPYVEVIATAKQDLKAGQIIDGVGGLLTFGSCENAAECQMQNYLPLGIAENCIVKHNVEAGQHLTYDDVILPEGRLIDKLRAEQNSYFSICPGIRIRR
jgi:predicted homoserine dehydrogenase-like protein